MYTHFSFYNESVYIDGLAQRKCQTRDFSDCSGLHAFLWINFILTQSEDAQRRRATFIQSALYYLQDYILLFLYTILISLLIYENY